MSQQFFGSETLTLRQLYDHVAQYCPQASYHIQDYSCRAVAGAFVENHVSDCYIRRALLS